MLSKVSFFCYRVSWVLVNSSLRSLLRSTNSSFIFLLKSLSACNLKLSFSNSSARALNTSNFTYRSFISTFRLSAMFVLNIKFYLSSFTGSCKSRTLTCRSLNSLTREPSVSFVILSEYSNPTTTSLKWWIFLFCSSIVLAFEAIVSRHSSRSLFSIFSCSLISRSCLNNSFRRVSVYNLKPSPSSFYFCKIVYVSYNLKKSSLILPVERSNSSIWSLRSFNSICNNWTCFSEAIKSSAYLSSVF